MSDLPTGTVTFLFSDIAGSTRLLQRLGPRYVEVLGVHQHLLRTAFAAHHGREVDTQGDSFFAAFPTAGDGLAAAAQAQEALARTAGDLGLAADALNRMGIAAACQDDMETAAQSWEEGLALARALGDPIHLEGPLNNLGEVAYIQGDLERASAYYEEALACTRRAGGSGVHVMLANLGNVARRQGNLTKAEARYREALELARETGDPRSMTETLEGMAMVVAAFGDGGRAALLLGAALAVRDAIGAPMPPHQRADLEDAIAAARTALGEDGWSATLAAGRALSLEQAVLEALEAASA